jgi:hypothetical protein
LVQWGEGNSLEVNVGRREWSSGRVKKWGVKTIA